MSDRDSDSSDLSEVPCPAHQSGGGTMAAGGAALADGFQFTRNLLNLSSPSSTMRSPAASSIGSIAIAGSLHSTWTSSYYGLDNFASGADRLWCTRTSFGSALDSECAHTPSNVTLLRR